MKLNPSVQSSLRVDDVSSTLTYIGEAPFASSESDPVWRIKKLETTGTILKILWADGNSNFDNIWIDRTTLTYI